MASLTVIFDFRPGPGTWRKPLRALLQRRIPRHVPLLNPAGHLVGVWKGCVPELRTPGPRGAVGHLVDLKGALRRFLPVLLASIALSLLLAGIANWIL